jgi:predicted nucleotidyltransferase
MEKKELAEKIKQFALLVKKELPVRMVILFGAWLEGLAREDDEIEVAVVVDLLEEDYVESRAKLVQLGRTVDRRIEPIIIERERKDPVGFFQEVLDNGRVIWQDPHAA